VAIFGKSWDFHVTDILKTTLDENLRMIFDTISFFKNKNKEVVFDAEHFFDGYKANPDYAMKTLKLLLRPERTVFAFAIPMEEHSPNEIKDITARVVSEFNVNVVFIATMTRHGGCHSIMAVLAGGRCRFRGQ